MWAAYMGHANVVSYLLDQGADPSLRNVYDETALSLAAAQGHKDIVLMLRAYKKP